MNLCQRLVIDSLPTAISKNPQTTADPPHPSSNIMQALQESSRTTWTCHYIFRREQEHPLSTRGTPTRPTHALRLASRRSARIRAQPLKFSWQENAGQPVHVSEPPGAVSGSVRRYADRHCVVYMGRGRVTGGKRVAFSEGCGCSACL